MIAVPGAGRSAAANSTLAVVVPTLDEREALPRLLERLLGAPSEAGAWEDRPERLIVADGGSADGTPELARAAGAEVVAARPGRGTQLAAGARATAEDLLLFLHADCVPAPGALEATRAALEAPGVVAVGLRQRVEASGPFYRLVERAADRRVRRGIVFGDSGLCVRREAYEAAGGYADVPLFEDVDLSRRLARLGEIRLVEEAELLVSPRRWRREGALRCTLRNWALRTAHSAGVQPARLARFYDFTSQPTAGRGPARARQATAEGS